MENLLRMSGLLNEEEGEKTDLGALEKQLANRHGNSNNEIDTTDRSSQSGSQPRTLTSPHSVSQADSIPTPQSEAKSPQDHGKKGEEVEELSDLMCSLVTNNCGETRYIGRFCRIMSPEAVS